MALIHCSNKKIKKVKYIEQNENNPYKPMGLWYAESDTWLKYYEKHIDKVMHCKYIYELMFEYSDYPDENENRMLKISDKKSFDDFTFKYGKVEKNKYSDHIYFILIFWNQVFDDCAGIEVIPLIKDRLKSNDPKIIKKYNKVFKFAKNIDNITIFFWLSFFDIGSGCVWNPSAIKSMKLVTSFK